MDHQDHPADPVVLPIRHQDLLTRRAIHRQVHLTLQVPHIQLQLAGLPPHLVAPPHLGIPHLLVRQPEEQLVLGPIDPSLRPLHTKTVTCQ